MMEKSQKIVFLQALIVTFLIFNLGIFLGFKLEENRINKVNTFYLESEMDLLDQRIQREIFDITTINCDKAIEANIDFADKIFAEAKIISRYESASRLSNELEFQHKRFDLLRTLFWINSIRIKRDCNADYDNLVYLYKLNDLSLEDKAKQSVFSNVLTGVKEKYGSKIMLIPIAADTGIPSIELLLDAYNVTELPVILINEEIQLNDLDEVKELEKYLE